MRIFLLISITFISGCVFSQTTKIKIKKEEPSHKVILAGSDTGFVFLEKILNDKKLVVVKNKYNLKIYYYFGYIIEDSSNQAGPIFEGNNDKLSQAMITAITERAKNGSISLKFERIKAYNEFNETINLNDVNVKVISDNK